MLKHKQSDSTETCSACIKNNSLIKKYEQLIHLYKKKQVRLSTDGSSRIKTTSHTMEMPNTEINCLKLVDAIGQIFRRRLKQGFQKMTFNKMDKLAVLSITHKIAKLIKKTAFMKIQSTLNCNGEANGKNKMDYQNVETIVPSSQQNN